MVSKTNLSQSEAEQLNIRDGCCFGPALIINGEINGEAYNSNSGLRFDVDFFTNFDDLMREETKQSGNSQFYNKGDWTFNVEDTVKKAENSYTWSQEIDTSDDSDKSIDGGFEDGVNHTPAEEAAHFGNASLTKAGDGHWVYKVTISDINVEKNNIFRVWEQRLNVDGFSVTSTVEEYPTPPEGGETPADDVNNWYVGAGSAYSHGGLATAFQLTKNTTVEFTNTYRQDTLDLTKTVLYNGREVNSSDEFTFDIQIPASYASDKNGDALEYGVVYSRDENDETDALHGDEDHKGVIKFTTVNGSNATAQIILYAGETATITLPAKVTVTVTETNYDGYAPSWGEEAGDHTASKTITLDLDADDALTCTNTTGAVLPSTGGTGVGLYLAFGSLLTLGAGLLLIQRRRKEGSDAV